VVQKTILVVDDEPTNIDVIKNVLQDGYKIKAAINGTKALAAAAKLPLPDLILLDIMMPELDGYEVCRRLKANPETRRIPVVFLSAKVTPDEQRRGMEMGAVAYLTKPVDPQSLLDTIDVVLSL
jgi:putative two-component system response regulator